MALAACGGEEQQVDRRTDTAPRIARAVADRLASRSDKVASLLDEGDACRARAEATVLRTELTQAINDREIPELYLEELSGVVNEIEVQIPPCEPTIPPSRKDKKDKKEKDDEGDD